MGIHSSGNHVRRTPGELWRVHFCPFARADDAIEAFLNVPFQWKGQRELEVSVNKVEHRAALSPVVKLKKREREVRALSDSDCPLGVER